MSQLVTPETDTSAGYERGPASSDRQRKLDWAASQATSLDPAPVTAL